MRKTAVLLFAALAGCASPYAQFYQGRTSAMEIPGYIDTGEAVRLYGSNDLERDVATLMRQGYYVVGSSSFTGGGQGATQGALMAQAVKLRAPVVLSFSKYIGTSTGVMPLTLPTSSTTNSTVNATAFGAGGTVNITGTGTSTTRGTTTSLIPYSVTRSDYVAVYLAKIKQRIGLYVKPLDDDTRRAIGTNSGVVVAVVVDGSPAFSADVFTGDIIISVDGVPIAGPDGWNDVLNSSGGRTVPVVIRRQSGTVTKMIAVNRL